ncbi:MAG TPA: alkaline phosphatase family protein [Puia sp.]|nr:alkaline phosphatase family protein [Puia sp.]
MKSFWIVLLFVSSGIAGFSQSVNKVVFVIADGIPADVIEKLHLPHLDTIVRQGGFTRAHVGGEKGGYSQTPTISAVGYNSLLTGTWVNKHNVWDNDIKAPNYNYRTIFRFFKEQYPQKKAAIFSTWLDNRTKLVGEGLPATGGIQLDRHYDGLENDTVNFPHDKSSDYMHRIDESVVDHAAESISNEGPDLSWVYLEYTDDMGRMYGDSPKFYAAVEMMDRQIGRLWAAMQARQQKYQENWTIFITTDHGRTAVNGKGHGGQSERERNTWIVTNAKGLSSYFKNGNPGIVDIMPTMADLLDVQIPRENEMEIDGVSLTGELSATEPSAVLKNGKLVVSWKAVSGKGNAKIWVSTTNRFKEGGKDDYELMATVPVDKQEAVIDVSGKPGAFYKIVIETPDNFLNRWVVVKN